jgi:hypothetical protein
VIAYIDTSALLRIVLREPGALIWRDRMGRLPEMATHDPALGAAARTFGFDVRGV